MSDEVKVECNRNGGCFKFMLNVAAIAVVYAYLCGACAADPDPQPEWHDEREGFKGVAGLVLDCIDAAKEVASERAQSETGR
jgi:hypothetical protein